MTGRADDRVHISRLTRDGQRGYIIADYQRGRRKVTLNRAEAAAFSRAHAEYLIARGRPDPRTKPQIEQADPIGRAPQPPTRPCASPVAHRGDRVGD